MMPLQVREIVRSARNQGSSSLMSPKYFLDLAISMSSLLNPWKVLKQRGIEPSKDLFTRDSIVEAFSAAYSISNYSLICTQDENGINLLKGIRLALDINLQPMNDRSHLTIYECGEKLYYPLGAATIENYFFNSRVDFS